MPSLFRRSFAELLGTFALVFIGAGAVASKYFPEATYGIFGVAVAHGLVLAVMVTALLGISGGHLNPAVTLGLMAVRRTDLRTGLAYIVAQLLGAVLAALLIKVVYPLGVVRPISLGTPTIANTIQFHQAMIMEGVMAFFLVSAVFGMQFGEVNVASRIVYTLVGLSAAYLATQLRTLISTSEPTPASSVTN